MSLTNGLDENSHLKCPTIQHTVCGQYTFKVGDQFDSYEELMARMELHSVESMVYYWHRDSRTVKNAHTKTSRPISARLRYYSLRFACIYGGDAGVRRPNNIKGLRASRANHKRTDCPAHILLRASKCGQKLEVLSVCNAHNHDISEQEVEKLPHTRRMSDNVKEEVLEMLKLKVERKKIIEYVQLRNDKKITRKCIYNLLARTTSTELEPVTPERRYEILQRIIQFSEKMGIETVSSISLNDDNLVDSNADYFNESDDPIEYISPESEFLIDEIITGPIIETEHPDVHTILSSNKTEPNCSISPGPDDFIILSTAVSEEESSPIFYDNQIEMNDNKINAYTDKEVSDQQVISFLDECGDQQNIQMRSEPIATLNDDSSNTVIVYLGEENLCEQKDIFKMDSEEIQFSPNYGIVLYETTTDANKTTRNDRKKSPEPEKDCDTNKSDRPIIKRRHIKNLVRRNILRISKCRQCRTDVRLVQAQVNYLQSKRDKLLMETKLLDMKRRKLLLEIERLE